MATSFSVPKGKMHGGDITNDEGNDGLQRNREAISRMLKLLNATPILLYHHQHPPPSQPSLQPLSIQTLDHGVLGSGHQQQQEDHDTPIPNLSVETAWYNENIELKNELRQCQAVNEKQRLDLEAKGAEILMLKKRISDLEAKEFCVPTTNAVQEKMDVCEPSEPLIIGKTKLQSSTCISSPSDLQVPSKLKISEPVVIDATDIDASKLVNQFNGQESSSKDKPISRISTSKLHAMSESRSKRGFFCICGLSFRSREILKSHILWHSKEKKFPCTRGCDEGFITASFLRKHLRVKHNIKIGKFVGCRDCGGCFSCMRELLKHRKEHHSSAPSSEDATANQASLLSSVPSSLPSSKLKLKLAATMDFTASAPGVSSPGRPSSNCIVNCPVDLQQPKQPTELEVPRSPTMDNTTTASVSVKPSPGSLTNVVERSVSTPHSEQLPYKPSPLLSSGNEPTSSQFADELIKMFDSGKGKAHKADLTKRHLGAYCTCGKRCSNLNVLRHHVWYRNFSQRLSCTICQRTYPGFSYLNRHMYGAHKMVPVGNSAVPITSAVTEKRTNQSLHENTVRSYNVTANNVQQQQRQAFLPLGHPTSLGAKFMCKICGRRYADLKQHMVRIHNTTPNTTMHECHDCGQVFQNMQEFFDHHTTAHKKGPANPSLKVHKRRDMKHGVVEFVDLEPSTLSATAPTTPGVSQFLQSAPPQPFFYCKCGRNFFRETSLISHIQSRSNGKPFKCESCLRPFITHAGLKQHILKFHKQIDYKKRFGCWECGSAFVYHSELIYHNRIAHLKENQSLLSKVSTSAPSSSAGDKSLLKIISVSSLKRF